jgi:hemoglobin
MALSAGQAIGVALAVALAITAIVMLARGSGGGSGFAPAPLVMHREKKSLYERLGGAFPIAAVVNRFSDEILKSPIVGVNSSNAFLRKWSREQVATRMPGLKFMRTLWVADATGGPQRYGGTRPSAARLDLSEAHRHLHITSREFDEVARILSETLDYFKVPAAEKGEVLGAFAAHKSEVVGGKSSAHPKGGPPMRCPFS